MSELIASTELFSPEAVQQAVGVMVGDGDDARPCTVFEVRALEARTGVKNWATTYSGYFDNAADLLKALGTLRSAKGIYLTPNPVNPALLARASNRLREVKKGESTSDGDITTRRWLLIDADPVRPSGISSSEAEHQAALERCRAIANYLSEHGWPEPVVADSGNGGHLLYRIDLPAQDEGLVERCLKALAAKFDDPAVKVDTSVHNPARIWKLYGTLTCKGDSTPDRPHRLSRLMSVPKQLVPVPAETLFELASLVSEAPATQLPQAETRTLSGQGHFAIEKFIATHLPHAQGPTPWKGGRRWILSPCPWNPAHTDNSAYVLELPSGAIAAGCQHDSCSQHNWHTLRALFDLRKSRYSGRGIYDVMKQVNASSGPRSGGPDRAAVDPDDLPLEPESAPFVPFPVDTLPEPVRGYVLELAAATGTEPAFAALVCLVVLAGVIGNRVHARVKKSWIEPAILWGALVAPSGAIKSPVLKLATRPLLDIYKLHRQEHTTALEEWEILRQQYEVEKEQWKSAKKKGEAVGEPPKAPPAPIEKRLMVSDVTCEKLGVLLQENPLGLLLLRDELAAWIGAFDRYASGGKGSDQPAWLSFYDGASVMIDRKTVAGTIFVERGAVSVLGSIQPGVLRRVFGEQERESGLLARLLTCMPPVRAAIWTDADLSAEAAQAWATLLKALMDLAPALDDLGQPKPRLVPLSARARARFIPWHDLHGEEVASTSRDDLASHFAKLKGMCARFALLFACIEAVQVGVAVTEIEEEHIQRGIRIAEWFKYESRRVYGVLAEDEDQSDRRRLVEYIARQGGSITVRQLQQRNRAYRRVKAAEAALEALVAAGEGAWEPVSPGSAGGRPTRTFRLKATSPPSSPPSNAPLTAPHTEQSPAAPTETVNETTCPDSPAPTEPLATAQERGSVDVCAVDSGEKLGPASEAGATVGGEDWGEV